MPRTLFGVTHAPYALASPQLNDTLNGAQITFYHNPNSITREGNKRQQSTMPDLTVGLEARDVTWIVTNERLLSDHYIIQITIPTCIRSPKREI
ncbi:hypothetical protein HPB48_000396 [Haemaphysalis longicornis]|uniref:Endonuclease/exonuclease/phosphatase domain-containing protein n=1 Tax=Haemaphysalis longicornis TaxID=44386 RepID=A0A9J6G9N3_HAELO|nr:hypothetical protein HPB48_000396 [Haemaphysalis longicornis]